MVYSYLFVKQGRGMTARLSCRRRGIYQDCLNQAVNKRDQAIAPSGEDKMRWGGEFLLFEHSHVPADGRGNHSQNID